METVQTPKRIINIPCAECSELFSPVITHTKICLQCVSRKNDITSEIEKEFTLDWCRYCERYMGKKWVLCKRESKELLSICLKKLTGIKDMRLIDANFVWTEEHSRRIKITVTLEKDFNKEICLRKSCVVEFREISTQCNDCKKNFTPHTWTACVQVRQKIKNQKTFFYLEQLLLKHSLHRSALKIESVKNGMDFFFSKKNEAEKLMDFLSSHVPHKKKLSKELISHDTKSQIYNYKYTYLFEIPKICREDLVIIPKKLISEFGGVNPIGICYKISNKIHLYDPVSMRKYEMNTTQYFNYENEINIIPFKENETLFYITDIYKENREFNSNVSLQDINNRFAYFVAARESDHKEFSGTTYLGHILNHGDYVKGYDITSLVCNEDLDHLKNQKYLPEVILVRKFYPDLKRFWKLKRMDVEKKDGAKKKKLFEKELQQEADEFQDFVEEIEQDKDLRVKFNLYKDFTYDKNVENLYDDEEIVKINELLDQEEENDNNQNNKINDHDNDETNAISKNEIKKEDGDIIGNN